MAFPPLVIVCGRMRSGKDTFADVLVRRFGYRRLSFAEPLKACAAHLFALDAAQLHGAAKDEVDPRWGVTPRRLLQWMGTDVMQFQFREQVCPEIGRSFWAKRLLRELESAQSAQSPHDRHVITDLRFRHELETIRAARPGACVVRVRRDGSERVSSSEREHVSETESDLLPVDHEIRNDAEAAAAFQHRAEEWMRETFTHD